MCPTPSKAWSSAGGSIREDQGTFGGGSNWRKYVTHIISLWSHCGQALSCLPLLPDCWQHSVMALGLTTGPQSRSQAPLSPT